ncbi:unnamed protein product [Bursaphelenchus xylophilus]|uniref:(pine wood nematode) hypothetical protein n=1 Tax=Bursaphelenchus xylophilus TaxID=6326 RepID=A0A1I7RTH1_BURXY|nr:unnamed protein product [Bursaphelenchus xylophilus]CAG9122452.1 unnamed protein product [Bursaphelenchus xylophilus]
MGDYTFEYAIEYPEKPYLQIQVGNDDRKVKVLLDTNRDYSMVFHKTCNDSGTPCSNNIHDYLYDPVMTGGSISSLSLNDEKHLRHNRFKGRFYADKIRIGDHDISLQLGVINRGNPAKNFEWDGVIGLGITRGNNYSILMELMKQLKVRRITIQEGHYHLQKKDKSDVKKSSGRITFGEYDGDLCGDFKYVQKGKGNGWTFTTEVTVGDDIYPDATVAILPGRDTQVDQASFNKYFENRKTLNQSLFGDIGFTIDGVTFNITKEDYSWYNDDLSKSYRARIDPIYPEYSYNFGLGSSFLKEYCVALTADDKFEEFQIGFAENKEAYKLMGSIFMIIFLLIAVRYV